MTTSAGPLNCRISVMGCSTTGAAIPELCHGEATPNVDEMLTQKNAGQSLRLWRTSPHKATVHPLRIRLGRPSRIFRRAIPTPFYSDDGTPAPAVISALVIQHPDQTVSLVGAHRRLDRRPHPLLLT
jgi:hypothetical protein